MNPRCHVIIGAGIAGQHHARVLKVLGVSRVTIMDSAHLTFTTEFSQCLTEALPGTVWHVCTPTNSHLSYLARLRDCRPRDPVILEKPIGRPGESSRFAHLAADAPVVVQNQYTYSGTLSLFAQLLKQRHPPSRLAISVVFAKSRPIGRFTDGDRRALGYEGFHQLAIVCRVLGALAGQRRANGVLRRSRATLMSNDETGYELTLDDDSTSIYLRSELTSATRRAAVSVEVPNQQAVLTFEANSWFTGAPRQTHVITVGSKELIVEEDLMRTGIKSCLDAIDARSARRRAFNQERAILIEALLDRAVSSMTAPREALRAV